MPDSLPTATSSCIIRDFAVSHIDNVMFSIFTFVLLARITMLAPPKFPISCSSSELVKELNLTKSGIKRGFSPPLPTFVAFLAAPQKTCGSLSRRCPIRLSVAPGADKEPSRAPIPSILFKIYSRPPSFAIK